MQFCQHPLENFFLCLLRIKFWTLIIYFQWDLTKLQYNTCRRRTRQFSALCCLIIAWPHVYHLSVWVWPRVAVGAILHCFRRFSSLLSANFFSAGGGIMSASNAPKRWPHDNHSVLGFDHIFDHKQNRSTRRQDCTRVWKSRFGVAERAKKSYSNRLGW